jgi:glycosyltransferase 2 family protein
MHESRRSEQGVAVAASVVDTEQQPERQTRLSALRWGIAIALAAVLLYRVLRGVDWMRVWHTVLGARWEYLALAALISVGSFVLRALRWRILLNAGASEPLRAASVFRANMAGYLGNNVLPARAGEVIRSLIISSQSSLSRTYVLTTALSERMTDAIVLVLLGSLMLSWVAKPAWMEGVARTMAVVAGAGALSLMILPHAEGLAVGIVQWLPIPSAVKERIKALVQQILLGIRAFHHVGRFAGFAAFTAAIWTADATSLIISARGLGLHIEYPAAFLLLTAMGLGSALPSTPGYVGIYQYAAVTVLAAFGIERDQALAYSLVTQVVGYLVVAVLGIPGLYGAWGRGKAKRINGEPVKV